MRVSLVVVVMLAVSCGKPPCSAATCATGCCDGVVASFNGGTISSSGTYTAPSTPGVYAVAAQTAGAPSTRLGVATIIVQ